MRAYLLLLNILISNLAYSQTNIIIIRHSADSFEFRLPAEYQFKMHEPTDFVIKTNVALQDSIKFNMSGEYLENYQHFTKTFDYHEYQMDVMQKRNGIWHVLGKSSFKIKGPRFVVTIDGDTISRHSTNIVSPNSKITVDLWSDTHDVNSLKIHDRQVAFAWLHDMKHVQRIRLSNLNRLDIEMKDLMQLMKVYNPSRKFHHLVIALPQVYDHFNYTVLALKQDARMYILKYENSGATMSK